MQFKLTDEQKMMQDMARDFAEKEILPTLKEDEKNHTFRPELVKKMARSRFLRLCDPGRIRRQWLRIFRVGSPRRTAGDGQWLLAGAPQHAEYRSGDHRQ